MPAPESAIIGIQVLPPKLFRHHRLSILMFLSLMNLAVMDMHGVLLESIHFPLHPSPPTVLQPSVMAIQLLWMQVLILCLIGIQAIPMKPLLHSGRSLIALLLLMLMDALVLLVFL